MDHISNASWSQASVYVEHGDCGDGYAYSYKIRCSRRSFRDDQPKDTEQKRKQRNRVISLLIVPSAKILSIQRAVDLVIVVECANEGWHNPACSISHTHCIVKIYGHYPVVEG